MKLLVMAYLDWDGALGRRRRQWLSNELLKPGRAP